MVTARNGRSLDLRSRGEAAFRINRRVVASLRFPGPGSCWTKLQRWTGGKVAATLTVTPSPSRP